MDPRTATVKLLAEAMGAVGSAVAGIIAVGDSAALTTSAIVATLGFAGLLVRQIVLGQRASLTIIDLKDREIDRRDDELHYLRWELETLRYRHGERLTDPGPFIARRRSDPEAPT